MATGTKGRQAVNARLTVSIEHALVTGGYGYVRRNEIYRTPDGRTLHNRIVGIRRMGTTGPEGFTVRAGAREG
jgi:hypothetical protein